MESTINPSFELVADDGYGQGTQQSQEWNVGTQQFCSNTACCNPNGRWLPVSWFLGTTKKGSASLYKTCSRCRTVDAEKKRKKRRRDETESATSRARITELENQLSELRASHIRALQTIEGLRNENASLAAASTLGPALTKIAKTCARAAMAWPPVQAPPKKALTEKQQPRVTGPVKGAASEWNLVPELAEKLPARSPLLSGGGIDEDLNFEVDIEVCQLPVSAGGGSDTRPAVEFE